jgi:serine/threonine protein kinase
MYNLAVGAAQPLTVIRERYRLDALIGEGGMASVWRAWDLTLQRPVAVKLLFARESHTEEVLVDRFLREARIAASVQHRNVINIVDFGTTLEGQPFMVMELLEGETLAARLRRQKPLPVADVVQIGHLTLRGLGAVHAAGIIHRDLKPENVYLKNEGGVVYPKILDFGISRSIEPAVGPRSALTTREGVIVGTPEYMSPEQARGVKQLDYRTDLYSMGVVLYEALTGQLPYTSENVGDLIIKIVTGSAKPAHVLAPSVPREISDVVTKAMARQPGDRYRDALEMQEALLLAANRANSQTLLPIFSDLPPQPGGRALEVRAPRSPRPALTVPRTQAVRMQMLASQQPANQVAAEPSRETLPPLLAAGAHQSLEAAAATLPPLATRPATKPSLSSAFGTLPPTISPSFSILEATPIPSSFLESERDLDSERPQAGAPPDELHAPAEVGAADEAQAAPDVGADEPEEDAPPFSSRPTEPHLSTPALETTRAASLPILPRRVLVRAAAALVLTCAGAGAFWLKPSPPPAPVSKPVERIAPPVQQVTLQLRGIPEGARVSLDGQPASERMQLAADGRTRSLAVEAKGKRPWQLSFVPQTDQSLDVALEDVPPSTPPTAASPAGHGNKRPTTTPGKRPQNKSHGVLRVPDF